MLKSVAYSVSVCFSITMHAWKFKESMCSLDCQCQWHRLNMWIPQQLSLLIYVFSQNRISVFQGHAYLFISFHCQLPQRLVDITSVRQQLLSQYDVLQSRIKELKKASENEVLFLISYDCWLLIADLNLLSQWFFSAMTLRICRNSWNCLMGIKWFFEPAISLCIHANISFVLPMNDQCPV